MSDSPEVHILMVALKDLAIELGRTPTRDEFASKIKNAKDRINRTFGSYTTMVHASGLEPAKVKKKVDNSIFDVDLEKHLSLYKPKELILPQNIDPYPDVASISDIHWPFVNQLVVNEFVCYVGDVKPTWVVLNGDAWDRYSHAKFPRSHNQFTPRQEDAMARQMNEEFWQKIKKASPKSKCYQLMGNHDIRPIKRVIEEYPEAEDWVKEKLNSMFTFPGVTTIFDPREELFLSNNVIAFHGYRGKLGEHRDYTLYCTLNGHTHLGGVVFRKIRGQVIWELNSGLAGDPLAKGLTYTPQKITHWTPGFSAIDKRGPRFIHL